MANGQFVQSALDALDHAIAAVAEAELDRLSDAVVAKQIEKAFESLARLQGANRPGQPGQPDQPESGPDQPDQPDYKEWDSLLYVTWYQPRQVHLVYSILRQLHQGAPKPLHVVDFGCGAWAVQMACALLEAERRRNSFACPVVVHGIDPSAAMRRLGEKLWVEWWNRAAAERGLESLVDTMDAMSASCGTYDSAATWERLTRGRHARTGVQWWFTAVHAVYEESLGVIRDFRNTAFDGLGRPEELFMLVTSDGSKKQLVDRLCEWKEAQKVQRIAPKASLDVPRVAQHTTKWRKSLCKTLRSNPGSMAKNYLKNDVEWGHSHNPIERDVARILFHT